MELWVRVRARVRARARARVGVRVRVRVRVSVRVRVRVSRMGSTVSMQTKTMNHVPTSTAACCVIGPHISLASPVSHSSHAKHNAIHP